MDNYNTLIIDTTREQLVVIATYKGKQASRALAIDAKKHQPLLLENIDLVLNELGICLKDIDYFSAVVGPGSFTGIRIGISTVNAFHLVTSKPLVGVNFFELMAYNEARESLLLIDAGRGNYYSAKLSGSKLDMGYLTAEEFRECKAEVKLFDKANTYIPELIAVVFGKIASGDITTTSLAPMYLRKSQAEREAGV